MSKEFEKLEKRIDGLADVMAEGFTNLHDRMDKRFGLMQSQIDQRFEQVDKRFEQVDKRFEQVDKRFETVDARHDTILNILDRHTKLLMENRIERAATIHRMDRLESDIVKIKKKIKLAN